MNRLLDFISEYALHQHVTDLTRPALMKNLDLVLSSSPTLGSDVTISPGMSDHDIVNFAINTNSRRVTKPLHKVYLYDRMDIDGLRNHTAKIRDQFMSTSPDSRSVEENWLFFKERIQAAIDMFLPSKMTKQKPDLPWITPLLKRQLRKRERLLRRAKRSDNRSSRTWAAYRSHRNKVTKAMKSAHNNYLNNVIGGSLETNPKKFWSYVKQRRTEPSGIPILRDDTSIYINAKDKAKILNKHFQSVFTTDDDSPPDLGPSQHMYSNIEDMFFSVQRVKKQLEKLNTSKAASPDGLPVRILYTCPQK